ncbi:MAG: GerMN domain-containing protein [Thermodesulfobacteriota bacterium]|nr:GerMN domain-containing protein [Thermodesulfobacteriota bacterium]
MNTKGKKKKRTQKNKKDKVFQKNFLKNIILWSVFTFCCFTCIYFLISIKYKKKEKKIEDVTIKSASFQVYFFDAGADRLVREFYEMKDFPSIDRKAEAIIKILLKKPKNKKLISPVPDGTKLLNIRIDSNGLAYVDFSNEFLNNHPGGSTSEMMTINSVVKSLTKSLPSVKAVQFLVEGKKFNTIAGHINCELPFKNEIEMNK